MITRPFGLTLLSLYFCFGSLGAQDTTYVTPKPPMSLARLAMHYYALDWTDAQWVSLSGRTLELFYIIDEIGEPFLEGIRGIDDPMIRDSLRRATGRLPYFEPATQRGAYVESVYSMRFTFPEYAPDPVDTTAYMLVPRSYVVDPRSLLRNYEKTHNAIYVDFNLNLLNHLGNPGSYLKFGGGFDVYVGGHWNEHWGATLGMGIEGNGKHRPFPEDPLPDRKDAATGVWLGGGIDRVLGTTDRGLLSLRGELGWGALNAANRVDPDEDYGWVQYRGLHTGIQFQYALRVGRYTVNESYIPDRTTARYSALNFSAGLRYRSYTGSRVGTGAFWFIGVGYRLGRDDFRKK